MSTSYVIHAATWGTTKLAGCSGYAVSVGRSVRKMGNNGAINPRLISAGRYDHRVALTTRSLGTVLGKLGSPATVPVPCASLSGQTLVLAVASEDDVLPVLNGTAELLTVPLGLILLAGLSWAQTGEGIESTLQVLPLSSNGTSDPWSKTTGALPALATDEEEWDVSGISWGGSELLGATGLRLNMDTRPEGIHNPGKIYPTTIRQAPATGPIDVTADITVPDRALFRTFGEHFAGGALGNLVITAVPFKQAAARDSGAGKTATITLTGAAEIVDVADQAPGTSTLRVHGISTDGVTPSLNWAVA